MKSVRKFENLHIALWLLKDTCWVTDFKTGGLIMIIPTIAVAIYITWMMRHIMAELFHNMAVCCWICANSIWMIGEFYYNDGLRPPAILFFSMGLLFIGYYYLVLVPRGQKKTAAAKNNQPNETGFDESQTF